jgi:hypothetical protein
MRKSVLVALSIALAGTCLLGGSSGTAAFSPQHPRIAGDRQNDDRDGPKARERADDDAYQPWGTWAWETHRPAGGLFPALITYHKDGTITGSDGVMYGIDFPPALNTTKESVLHGVWERTGPHSFRGMSLWLQFASNGNVIAWGRARSDLQFVGDADHFEGTMYVDSLACPTPFTCPDPMTTPWPSTATARAVTATRVQRIEPPGM